MPMPLCNAYDMNQLTPDPIETVARDAHRSLCITFGSTAQREFGPIRLERIGFADIPVLTVPVTCKERDIASLVPVARQMAFAYLAERDISDEHLTFRPTVQSHYRKRKFTDQDGKQRMGVPHDIHFEMSTMLRDAIEWTSGRTRGTLKAGWEL